MNKKNLDFEKKVFGKFEKRLGLLEKIDEPEVRFCEIFMRDQF